MGSSCSSMGKHVPARTDAPLHRLPNLIVNDPESLQHEVNRVGTPDPSSEASVQVLRDCLFPSSVAEAFKDLAYDRGLLENYCEAIADGYRVPARVSAAGRFIDWLGSIP